MTTLYSAAVTIKGVKKRSVSFKLDHDEKQALRSLVTTVAAVNSLTPAGNDLRCGVRASKAYCTKVAEGLTSLLNLEDEEVLIVTGEHLKDLFNYQKQLNAMLEGKTNRSKEVELSSKSVGQLIRVGKALTKYQEDTMGSINLGGNTITRSRVAQVVTFLKGVNRNVLIKSY